MLCTLLLALIDLLRREVIPVTPAELLVDIGGPRRAVITMLVRLVRLQHRVVRSVLLEGWLFDQIGVAKALEHAY